MAGIRCRCSDFEESKELLIKGIEFGYNKANEWHDLRKNPDDLPPVAVADASIDVLTDSGKLAFYYWGENCWYHTNANKIDSPKAWCEIPRFEEESK